MWLYVRVEQIPDLPRRFYRSAISGPVPDAPFVPGFIFYVRIESPKPKNLEGPTPNPINWKPLPQKHSLRPQPQSPKPQTPINEQNKEKNYKEWGLRCKPDWIECTVTLNFTNWSKKVLQVVKCKSFKSKLPRTLLTKTWPDPASLFINIKLGLVLIVLTLSRPDYLHSLSQIWEKV